MGRAAGNSTRFRYETIFREPERIERGTDRVFFLMEAPVSALAS
jgi:hypothetical protein